MPIQPGTFKRLPPKEEILAAIEEEKRYNLEVMSFIWYIKPVAEKFGDKAYEVAAKSLSGSGLKVTASQLKKIAKDLDTKEGKNRYAEIWQNHLRRVTG